MLYEFAVNDPLGTIVALTTIIAFIIVLVIPLFMEESLVRDIIIYVSSTFALIGALFFISYTLPKRYAYYEEKFTEYFDETPESIDFDDGDFTVKTEEKIYFLPT